MLRHRLSDAFQHLLRPLSDGPHPLLQELLARCFGLDFSQLLGTVGRGTRRFLRQLRQRLVKLAVVQLPEKLLDLRGFKRGFR